MPNTTKAHVSRREMLRRQQEAELRKQRTIKIVLIAVAVVVVIAIIAVIIAVVQKKKYDANVNGDPNSQINPPDLTSDGSAIIANPAAKGNALTIDIYEDFQCPICKEVEDKFGPAFDQIVASNQAVVQYHVMTFLDQNLGNDSSSRAAIGATCADTIGKFDAYHDAVFENQPEEGTGYTDQQLGTTFAQDAGITGDDLTKFQQCYNNRQTSQVVQTMNNNNLKVVQGTPDVYANGKQIDLNTLMNLSGNDANTLLTALKQTAGIS